LPSSSTHKVEDLEWIVRTQVADSFLFVRSDSPFRSIRELFKHAQANPGKLRVGATGFGTVDDVTVRVLEKKGYKMTTVPYPKPGERYAAALGGHTEVLYEQAGDVLQYLKAGQLKPLIIFAEKRHPAFPDVPSSKELGLDVTLPQFRGLVTRKGVPPERVKALADAFTRAMQTPQWKKFADEWYMSPDSVMTHEQFGPWIASEAATLERSSPAPAASTTSPAASSSAPGSGRGSSWSAWAWPARPRSSRTFVGSRRATAPSGWPASAGARSPLPSR